ncbi:MAG: AAA family ATPase, partial [Candidatus Ornithospirochaeta sp.]|nr:AAA family ATPase [Candidatus Ornithospirochaeta sp.]
MLLNMTIENFKSVKSPQTISFEAVKDSRLPASKVVQVNEKLSVIKTSAIIGPNGAGKSSFVRALEVLKRIVTSSEEEENVLTKSLAGTTFAYGIDKATPATISIDVLLDKGEDGNPEKPSVIARYTIKANREKIFEESLYHIIGGSRKLMFERIINDEGYSYRFGKLYRGEKKRQAAKLSETRTFLQGSALKGGATSSELYYWFIDSLNILPMGVSEKAEQFCVDMLKAHPGWAEQLLNYLWSVDITDINRIEVKESPDGKEHLRFTHIYVNDKKAEGYSNLFSKESLSLRRLVSIGIAFFETFITEKTLVIDDFGQLL